MGESHFETEARRFVGRVFAADEAKDVEGFLALLTEDVVFRLGSQPELRGREPVRAVVSGLFAAMASIHHKFVDLWVTGDRLALRAEATMTPHGGEAVTLPYMNALRLSERGQAAEYRIHIDLSPALGARSRQ